MDRGVAARIGNDTLHILRDRRYTAPSGRQVDLTRALDSCIAATVECPPDTETFRQIERRVQTRFSVENATVLQVGRRMAGAGPVAALNFASATHPGGGFLTGARAQEESIARSSGLYAALRSRAMYAYHGGRADAMFSDWVIRSPNVPVFRSDDGELLEQPWTMTVLTCAAVNGVALQRHAPERLAEVPQAMKRRTDRVLAVAAAHDVRRFILGAWGCGAFGLEPEMMACIFRDALLGAYRGVFEEIAFAITDWSPDERFISPFRRAFSDPDHAPA
jgi:uncharacterized protein (TIGR02452 family)